MASSRLDIVLVVHFHLSVREVNQVDQRHCVEAPPAFSTYIVGPHPSERYDEPVLVKQA